MSVLLRALLGLASMLSTLVRSLKRSSLELTAELRERGLVPMQARRKPSWNGALEHRFIADANSGEVGVFVKEAVIMQNARVPRRVGLFTIAIRAFGSGRTGGSATSGRGANLTESYPAAFARSRARDSRRFGGCCSGCRDNVIGERLISSREILVAPSCVRTPARIGREPRKGTHGNGG